MSELVDELRKLTNVIAVEHNEKMNRIDHAIFGNGKEGLITKMARTEEQLAEIATIKKSIDNIQQDIKVLLMFKAQESGKNEARGNYNADKKWIITSIIALASVALTALGMTVI